MECRRVYSHERTLKGSNVLFVCLREYSSGRRGLVDMGCHSSTGRAAVS